MNEDIYFYKTKKYILFNNNIIKQSKIAKI